MNIYKTSLRGHGVYSLELNIPDNKKEHITCRFLKNGKKHRTDGPAVVTWKEYRRGASRFYYIMGELVPKESFLKVLHADYEDLPLYINEPLLKYIAMDRLAGIRSGIMLSKDHEYEVEVKARTRVLSLKQLKVLDFTRTLNRLVRINIQHLKPFQ